MEKQDEILLKAMEVGYIWYPLSCPEDCYRYKIDCLYFNLKMGRYYLYVSDGVGEIFSEDFGKEWSIDKPVGCPNDE